MAETDGPNASKYGSSAASRLSDTEEFSKKYWQVMRKEKKKFDKLDEKEQEAELERIARIKNNLDIENEKKLHKFTLENIKERNKIIYAGAEGAQKVLLEGFNLIENATNLINNTVSTKVDDFINTYQKYQTAIETRLQGSDLTYSNLTQSISNTVGTSSLVTQTKVLSKLSELIEKGISYNVEQRAFLASVSDKIATTFDAFDSNLLRLIRIQQADTTASRLGIESALTKFLNENFSDTSYLSDVKTSSISSILTNAESLMGYQGGSEFDYAIQKWLGSLYSVGVSSGTITSLASGLNALATGDIDSLSGTLQTLFAMAAQSQGLNYGSLIGNLNSSSDISSLLTGIVQLGSSLTSSNISNVTRSQYANLLGLSVSDMVALSNLTSSDLSSIAENMLNYEGTLTETATGLSTIGSRMSLTEKIDNLLENALTNVGVRISSNTGLYATWQTANLLQETGLDKGISALASAIPFVGTIDPVAMLKGGIAGYSTIAELLSIISNLGSGNIGFDLSALGAKDVLREGVGSTGIVTTGVSTNTSGLMTIGGSSPWASGTDVTNYTGTEPSEDISEVLQEKVTTQLDNIYSTISSWDYYIKNNRGV